MNRYFFDNRLVGRDSEIELIKNEYNKLLKGETAVVAVVGVPGVGKTHLCKFALGQIKEKILVSVKFIENTERSLAAITELLGQITDHLLMQPRDTIDMVAQKADAKISGDFALLSSICPKINNLLRASRSVNLKDYERLKYKVKNAICNFIEIASKHLSPMIIYLDDLQWADRLSLEIIRALLNKKTLNLMFAFSYRENKNDNMKRLIEALETRSVFIDLEPLSRPEVEEYLCLQLKDSIENIDELTSVVYGLTSGNPFYIKETIMKLSHDDILAYSEEKQIWELRINGVNNFIVNNDVEKIIRDKVFKSDNHELLELVSCLNGKADYDMLKLLYGKREMDAHMQTNIDSAVIMKYKENDGRISVLFTHDIIYRLVDSRMTARQKEIIHYRIAEKLLNDTTVKIENKDLFIASHLIRASKEMAYGGADRWTRLLFEAGMQEKHRASLDAALRIFEFCIDILPYSAERDERFITDVQLELAECLCVVRRYEESQEIVERLIENNKDKALMLAIKVKQLYLYHYQRDHKKTLETGREILKRLGFGFGKYRLPFDLLAGRLIYSKKKIESMADMPETMDERAGIIIDTLGIMNSSAAVSDDTLTACIGLSAALVSAKYGESGNTLGGLVSYAYVLYTVWKDFKKTKLLVDLIIDISEKTADRSSSGMVYFIIGAFLTHWRDPIEKADYYLQKSIEYGEMTGDFLFLGYSISTSLDVKAFMGRGLSGLLDYIEDCKTKYAETQQHETAYNLEAYAYHIAALKHGDDGCGFDMVGQKYPMLTPFEKLTEKTLLLERLLLLGELEQGYKLVKIAAPLMRSNKGLICRVSTVFFSLLIRAGIHKELKKSEQLRNKTQINRLLKELKYWAGVQEENFFGHYALALAEYETLEGSRLSDMYDKAAGHAHKNGNLSLEGLAYLLAAKRTGTGGRLGKFYAAEGAKLYKKLGADRIAKKIETEYRLEKDDGREGAADAAVSIKSEPLLHAFIRDAEALGEDDKTELFLNKIREAGFAHRCAVIFEKGKRLCLKYQTERDGRVKKYGEPVNINNISHLPRKVIRYAARMQKEAVIDSRDINTLFENDDYVAGNPDLYIACIPMLNCGVLTGVLYLEKHDVPIDEEAIFEIKSILPALVTSYSEINDIVIKDLFVPVKSPKILSNRETDIVKLLAQGLSNEQMGDMLGLSVGTVKKHMSSIMIKLDADNRIMALIKAKELNLI